MLETYPEEIWKAWFKMLIILEVDEHHSMYMSVRLKGITI